MRKLFYNPAEVPVEVILESRILGFKKRYVCLSGGGPMWMEELFKLAATDTFDNVQVYLTSHNQAYYRDSYSPLEKVPAEGWVSLKNCKNGGGYLKDRTGLNKL
ncbi:MAG: hypothetical protein K2O89_02570 [Clostridia bacterium]|nr:hypothetical protein [Clostridia bacterium]